MADENNEGQNPTPKPEEEMTADELKALHEDEDFIATFSEEDKKDPEKVEKLNEAILRSAQTTVHQKRHYRELAGKNGKAPEKKEEPAAPTAQEKKDEKKVDPIVAQDFRIDHPELSKEQQLKVIAHAGAYGITPEEAFKDPMIQAYIKNTNVQEDVEEGSPAPSRKAGGGIAEKDWSNATPAEMVEARRKIEYPNG